MSEYTRIEWADSTVNFWSGCTKVSAGCMHCYAETLSKRKLGNIGQWGTGAPRKLHESAFSLALRLNKNPWVCPNGNVPMKGAPGGHGPYSGDAIKSPQPCCECGTMLHRRRVFSLSLGDWLDPEVPIEWLARMLDTIRQCDQVEWILCTKRPELWRERMEAVTRHNENTHGDMAFWQWMVDWIDPKSIPPKHVTVLTSVENQQAAEERIPALLKIPAVRRGLSCEPLLGRIDLYETDWVDCMGHPNIDWVVIGGESGPGARVFVAEHAQDLLRQCRTAGVACFIKQMGDHPFCDNANVFDFPDDVALKFADPGSAFASCWPLFKSPKGGDWNEWPEQLRVRQFPEVP